jgi:Kef-type K+ transport system membrane component KefB
MEPLLALAALAPEGSSDIATIFLMLAALVAAAKGGGAIAVRFGQPAVLGELLAGIVVGPAMLGLADPANPAIHVMAEFGVVILLFQIGLHTDLGALFKVGAAASVVGGVGVVLPFGLGYLAADMLGLASLPAILCGAAMTATSIGISARVLGDVGVLDSPEGRTVLGAAVLDDVVGLVILAVTATLATGAEVTMFGILKTAGAAFGFLVVALVAGELLVPRLFALIDRMPVSGTTGALALAFALALAAAADRGGSALIIGSFAAGLILHKTPQRAKIEQSTTTLGYFFVPVFFASVGASVDLAALSDPAALQLGGILLAIGIVTKFVAGYAPFWVPLRYALVGTAMVPRGEVGLIFAQMGLTSGVISPAVFGSLMVMVIGTTLVTPPWLGWLVRRGGPPSPAQDIGGMDDLVVGERRT